MRKSPPLGQVVLVLAAAAGCGRVGDKRAAAGPRLEVRWTGSEAATFHAAAAASWCDSLNLLEIVALSGDTGIAIALYPRDSIATGSYPVHPPAAADSTPPSSAIGLRWFSQTSVRGFQSDSGELSLTRAADGSLAGRFRAAAHPVTGKGPLTLTGSFEELRQQTASRGCTTAPAGGTPARAEEDSESGLD